MIPPPIPSVLLPEPPDPDTLPVPPQLQWHPLETTGGDEGGGVTATIEVPPPRAEVAIELGRALFSTTTTCRCPHRLRHHRWQGME
jgi:hypothetical protein